MERLWPHVVSRAWEWKGTHRRRSSRPQVAEAPTGLTGLRFGTIAVSALINKDLSLQSSNVPLG